MGEITGFPGIASTTVPNILPLACWPPRNSLGAASLAQQKAPNQQ
jgi:hypothetical protein